MPFLPRQTVIVPTDFTEACGRALDTAAELVVDPSGLHLVHVLATYGSTFHGQIEYDPVLAEIAERLRALAEERGLRGARVHCPVGTPGTEIVRLVDEVGADMVIMPSRGRSGLERFFLGSVTERVVRHAGCPVLVLRV